jgi:hypothetical protein
MRRPTLLFLLILLLALLLTACRACSGRQGQIQPIRPTPTPGGQVVGLPIPVAFSELNENPAAYQNQLIRVSGAFTRLELEPCRQRRGPQIQWGLISEELRLDSVGLTPIVRLAPEGTPMTIDGWWRLYQGPLGCGKQPPDGFAWYLDAAQIIAPNPLPQFGELPPPPTWQPTPPRLQPAHPGNIGDADGRHPAPRRRLSRNSPNQHADRHPARQPTRPAHGDSRLPADQHAPDRRHASPPPHPPPAERLRQRPPPPAPPRRRPWRPPRPAPATPRRQPTPRPCQPPHPATSPVKRKT